MLQETHEFNKKFNKKSPLCIEKKDEEMIKQLANTNELLKLRKQIHTKK